MLLWNAILITVCFICPLQNSELYFEVRRPVWLPSLTKPAISKMAKNSFQAFAEGRKRPTCFLANLTSTPQFTRRTHQWRTCTWESSEKYFKLACSYIPWLSCHFIHAGCGRFLLGENSSSQCWHLLLNACFNFLGPLTGTKGLNRRKRTENRDETQRLKRTVSMRCFRICTCKIMFFSLCNQRLLSVTTSPLG